MAALLLHGLLLPEGKHAHESIECLRVALDLDPTLGGRQRLEGQLHAERRRHLRVILLIVAQASSLSCHSRPGLSRLRVQRQTLESGR
jgi:hypothetical protein